MQYKYQAHKMFLMILSKLPLHYLLPPSLMLITGKQFYNLEHEFVVEFKYTISSK